jgi:hypothetical protein
MKHFLSYLAGLIMVALCGAGVGWAWRDHQQAVLDAQGLQKASRRLEEALLKLRERADQLEASQKEVAKAILQRRRP